MIFRLASWWRAQAQNRQSPPQNRIEAPGDDAIGLAAMTRFEQGARLARMKKPRRRGVAGRSHDRD
jgi:hypothetical protein